MIVWMVVRNIFFISSDHYHHKHVNNPCDVENKDVWTFERSVVPSMHVNRYQGIKKLTDYKVESGCCRKFSSSFKRNKLHLIMEMMKHSVGTPIPDKRLNKSFDEFSLGWPAKDLVQKIEEK